MCKLNFICKKKGEILNDNQVHIQGIELGVLDCPYYIVKSEEETDVDFTFHYMDPNEDVRSISFDKLELKYGQCTGRLYTFKVKQQIGEHVANEVWDDFKKNINNINVSNIVETNLKIGYNIVKRLYFNKFKIGD